MNQQRELSPTVRTFIMNWVDIVNQNPDSKLGEWLYAFGAMSALALKSQPLSKDQLMDAVKFMNESLARVYDNTEDTFRPNIIQ